MTKTCQMCQATALRLYRVLTGTRGHQQVCAECRDCYQD